MTCGGLLAPRWRTGIRVIRVYLAVIVEDALVWERPVTNRESSRPDNHYQGLLHLPDTSWSGWCSSLDRILGRSVLIASVCDYWSVKDLVSHIAVWDDVAVRKVLALCDGEKPLRIRDVDALNDREVELREDRDINDLPEEMRANRIRLPTAVERAYFRPGDIIDRVRATIAEDTWEHHDVHRRQIDRAFPLQ